MLSFLSATKIVKRNGACVTWEDQVIGRKQKGHAWLDRINKVMSAREDNTTTVIRDIVEHLVWNDDVSDEERERNEMGIEHLGSWLDENFDVEEWESDHSVHNKYKNDRRANALANKLKNEIGDEDDAARYIWNAGNEAEEWVDRGSFVAVGKSWTRWAKTILIGTTTTSGEPRTRGIPLWWSG
jgi:hypothetical protein